MANANYIKEQIAKSSAKQQAVSEVTQILKAVLGDNSADYVDAVNLIVSAAFGFAQRKLGVSSTVVEFLIHGEITAVDAVTNAVGDSVNSHSGLAVAKAIAEALSATGTGLVLETFLVSLGLSGGGVIIGGAVAAYLVGNQVSSLASQGWEYFIGPTSEVRILEDNVQILSEGSMNDILHHYWDGSYMGVNGGHATLMKLIKKSFTCKIKSSLPIYPNP
jgi:hypothetical protein